MERLSSARRYQGLRILGFNAHSLKSFLSHVAFAETFPVHVNLHFDVALEESHHRDIAMGKKRKAIAEPATRPAPAAGKHKAKAKDATPTAMGNNWMRLQAVGVPCPS